MRIRKEIRRGQIYILQNNLTFSQCTIIRKKKVLINNSQSYKAFVLFFLG